MRKYGVNWLLFSIGYFLVFIVLMFWINQIVDAFWPPRVTRGGMLHVNHWLLQGTGFLLMSFWGARKKAKNKEKAVRATEQEPFVEQNTLPTSPTTTVTPALSAHLRKTFGVASAVVGVITVAAHLFTDSVEVPVVLAYTFGVPLCIMFGFYLTAKASEPINSRKAARASGVQNVPRTDAENLSVSVPIRAVDAETPVVLRRQ